MKRFTYTNVRSVLQPDIDSKDEAYCFISGMHTNLEFHHIFNGAYKKKSEEDGYWVYLRCDIHRGLHDTPQGRALWTSMKEQCQEHYEKYHSRESFIKRYGKNYL